MAQLTVEVMGMSERQGVASVKFDQSDDTTYAEPLQEIPLSRLDILDKQVSTFIDVSHVHGLSMDNDVRKTIGLCGLYVGPVSSKPDWVNSEILFLFFPSFQASMKLNESTTGPFPAVNIAIRPFW